MMREACDLAKHRFVVMAVVVAASILLPCARGGTVYSYADLVGQMTDLERLALLPDPGEQGALFSSYDRRSRYDETKDGYEAWDYNDDTQGAVRAEGDQLVLAEMQGPGVIWRMWSARAQSGHVRIFLDGADQPAVDLSFEDYFDARQPPFQYPELSYTAAAGKNLYVPIPYNQSCRIVADKGWGAYYHVTYTTFPKDVQVPTFSTNLPPEAIAALRKLNDFFKTGLGTDPAGQRKGQDMVKTTVTVNPGQTGTVVRLTGPRAITALRAKADFKNPVAVPATLRKLALQITWDGQPQPAVWTPLGDFFGTGPGENPYRSLPAGMTESNGCYAFWYMPFASDALVELVNDDDTPHQVAFEVVHAPLTRPVGQLGRFHAKWHRGLGKGVTMAYGDHDWRILRTEGRGRFVGFSLNVWNPTPLWWGEGDEKFFVDGEKTPSTFGTGTEDYFGYAWGLAERFARPYHAQPLNDNNTGHLSNVRWQIMDNVPFQQSFDGYLERWTGGQPNLRGTLFAATVYWYLASDGTDPIPALPLEQRFGYWPRPPGEQPQKP